ncbi:class III signal peptide-containing protein [Candidatus Micrarchaeota archaeon]|nr:class III signal peptide-containing protein [Candidatus Micrarchaeota archaeon]
MDQKGQGSFEYILMVGGVLLLVAVTIVMLRGGVINSGKDSVNSSYVNYANATNTSGYV